MRTLNHSEIYEVNGGFKLKKIGSELATIALGFITLGPAGAGMAIGSIIAAHGIDKFIDML